MGNRLSNMFKSTNRRPPRVIATASEKANVVGTTIPTATVVVDDNLGEDDNELNDPDLKRFDNGIKQRTEKVLGSLENGMKQGGLELSALEDVTSGLMGMNEDVVNYVLECDLDVWSNEEMKELVSDYFKNSLQALDFCGVLERSVQQARDNQMYIETALSKMPAEGNPPDEACKQILLELDNFAHAANPFSSEFHKLFNDVYDRQKRLQEKLTEKRKKYHKKEKNARAMKKITTVILTASCVSLVVCAAVAMAVVSPVLAGGVSAAASLPFEAMHGWLDKLWSHYEQRVRNERVITDAAHWGTWVAIRDFDTINTEVRRLKSEIEGFNRNIEFAKERGDSLAVQNSIRMIRRKHDQFVKQLDDLGSHVNECIKRITKARAVVLDRIMAQSEDNRT